MEALPFPELYRDAEAGQEALEKFGPELYRDAQARQEAFDKFGESSWWKWERGSTLLFWRWSLYKNLARYGVPPFYWGIIPSFLPIFK